MLFGRHCSSHHINLPICIYESGGFSTNHYYDIARQERRSIISNYLDGGLEWYDSILLRKELSNEPLFFIFQKLTYKKKLQSVTLFLIRFLVSIQHIVKK